MKLRLLLIGSGWAGRHHALAAAEHPQAELAAIVDPQEEKAAALASRMGAIPHYRSLDEAEQAGVAYDGALICTLPDTHIDLCRQLIIRGKHVLCEKPMGRSAEELLKLEADRARAGVAAGVNCNQRFAPAYRMLKQRIADGEEVRLIQIAMQQQGPTARTGHINEHFLLTDACCHLIDTLRYLNGEIEEVFAFGRRIDSEILSEVVVSLAFANGSVGTMAHTFVGGRLETQHPFQQLDVSTNRARYAVDNLVDDLRIYPHDDLYHQRWTPSAFEARDYAMTMRASVGAWIDSVSSGGGAPVDVRDAWRNALVVEACVRSITTGQAVRLS